MALLKDIKDALKDLLAIDQLTDRITTKWENLMKTLQEFKDKLAEADAQTNAIGDEVARIAAVIDELVAKLAAGGLTEAEEAEIFSGITDQADKLRTTKETLQGVGKDPEPPTP